MKAFLSDLAGVTKYLAEHQTEGRQALLDAKLVVMPPEIFMKVKPYVTDMKLRPNIDNLKKQQDVLLSAGFIDKKIDLTPIVDTSYLPQ